MTDLQIRAFTAMGQIFVAIAVGIIAGRQWGTARDKLKADLFDKRFKVVTDLRLQLDATQGRPVELLSIYSLRDLVREAGFLFGKDIRRASEELTNSIQEVSALRAMREDAIQQAKALIQEEFFITGPAHGWKIDLSQEQLMKIQSLRNQADAKTKLGQEIGDKLREKTLKMLENIEKFDAKVAEYLTLKH
ncbi:hypothetical protein N5D13_00965 [Stenotrophomonas maltophilia]|uniref:hypothetical protein n=1 Tax=Stenotrophomonas maltophilia TaxID=40324 RepID=UPI00244D2602|nr:hypothetical protein [Stenotrophomonas maltophilia]MDH0071741.1 hypothetical protein [Stenotrophomonas maltophilia]MDH0104604.1 hypothetical protein [Stenotrophomonas maltophilia]MDH0330946.1 hypothetical protein [Stenotrophomonas maltophilia]MDH0632537.1 hypothetical protein [Stenotrophomonas maltophilia]MDH0641186.1 hypothetical protein [Stenotrophomonas maltophilia]